MQSTSTLIHIRALHEKRSIPHTRDKLAGLGSAEGGGVEGGGGEVDVAEHRDDGG